MPIDPGTASLVISGVSAVSNIIGGIFGSNSAKKENKRREEAARREQEARNRAAAATNRFNQQQHADNQENYHNNRAFQYDTAVKNWAYNQSIQDYQYLQTVRQYGKSVENTENQLVFNSIAAMDAYETEQFSLNELFTEERFNRQGALVDKLQQEGQAGMRQAGNSRMKSIQSSIAASGRNSAIMDASLVSSVEQSQRNMRSISLQKYGADQAALAQMMIKPEAPPAIPKPVLGPERIFTEPMLAEPGFVGQPAQVDATAPLIAGFSSAASALAGVNWGSAFGGNSTTTTNTTNYLMSGNTLGTSSSIG